jgi:type IV pilus assembly protein PilM
MFFARGCVGIDVGTDTIKAAHLIESRGKWAVKGLYKIKNPLMRTTFSETGDKEILTECLQEIKKAFSCNKCVMGVDGHRVVFRNLQFPRLHMKELKEAVYWEAREFSTMFNGDFVYDFELLEQQSDHCRVLIAGADREYIMDYIKIARDAGLNLSVLDVYPLAAARLLSQKEKNSVVAVIDMGSSHTEITVVEKGRAFLNRTVDFGGSNLVEIVSNLLSMDKLQAEQVIIDPGPYREKIQEKVTAALQELMIEISRFFDFYSIQNKGKQINYAVLAGNGGKLWCWSRAFADYFNIQLVSANNMGFQLKSLDNSGNIDYMEYFNAIGFALRG